MNGKKLTKVYVGLRLGNAKVQILDRILHVKLLVFPGSLSLTSELPDDDQVPIATVDQEVNEETNMTSSRLATVSLMSRPR